MKKTILCHLLLLSLFGLSAHAVADQSACKGLPSHAALKQAISSASAADTSGLNLNMWATVVNRDGIVCAVAYTGNKRGDQWPGSRVISAQKANTANAFSLNGLAISTAELYASVQGTSGANGATMLGGSLYGLQHSNPVNAEAAYQGDARDYGTRKDPMVGEKIGGVNTFGGGLALYNRRGIVIGAIGVSGDTSCADHNQAWEARHLLALDYVSAGPASVFYGDKAHPDNMLIEGLNVTGQSANEVTDGFEQPPCFNALNPADLTPVRSVRRGRGNINN